MITNAIISDWESHKNARSITVLNYFLLLTFDFTQSTVRLWMPNNRMNQDSKYDDSVEVCIEMAVGGSRRFQDR